MSSGFDPFVRPSLSLPRSGVLAEPRCRAPTRGADLIDGPGALADQPFPYPVERLEIELISGLHGDDLFRSNPIGTHRRRGSETRSFWGDAIAHGNGF